MKKLNRIVTSCLIGFSILNTTSCIAQDENKKGPEWQRKDTIRVNGSEALFYPMRDITSNYMKQDIGTHIKLEATGSAAGIMDLISGNCEMAMSTRQLTKQEKAEIADVGKKLKEIKVAKEVLVLVTSNKNPIYELSIFQCAQIFAGNIVNWDTIGGENEKIKVFIRSNNTGCYLGFKSMIMDKYSLDYSENALECKSNYEVKQKLQKYPYGISFLGYGAITQNTNKGLKPIRIENAKGEFIAPTKENIESGNYDLTRDCYIYLEEKNYEKYLRYIEFIKNNDSKVILQDAGFLYLNTF